MLRESKLLARSPMIGACGISYEVSRFIALFEDMGQMGEGCFSCDS